MLSNHSQNLSSFRIIEPKRFHQNQSSVLSQTQMPIMTHRSNSAVPNNITINQQYYDYNFNQQHQQHQHQQQQQQKQIVQQNSLNQRTRNLSDTDSSCIPETTSESGISDLDMSEKCNCCPYGYHIDVDFVTFLNTLDGKNLNKQLKKIQRKRNEHLQRSMEYVIDEVEKIKQATGDMNYNRNVQNQRYNSTCESNSFQRSIVIPQNLKNTINKIDQHLNDDDQDVFQEQKSHRVYQENLNSNNSINRNRSASSFNQANNVSISQMNSSAHNISSSSLPPPQDRNFYLKSSKSFHTSSQYPNQFDNQNILDIHNQHHNHHMNLIQQQQQQPQPQQQQQQDFINNQQVFVQQQLPRRSYSSCAEPNNTQNVNRNIIITETRRCMSNRSSPVRPVQPNYVQITDARRSRSVNRNSESPVEKQSYKREIKINLAQPEPKKPAPKPELNEEKYYYNNIDEQETKTITTTTTKEPKPKLVQPQPIKKINNVITIQPEVQEEVLLNLFSCNNSGSISSDSSESLHQYEQETKLKINETYVPNEPVKKAERKRLNTTNLMLEKRLAELEKKLEKLPELEIKNNILLEEKQLLIKQILNSRQTKPQPEVPKEPAKIYRTIGCDSIEFNQTRDIGINCKTNTRDIGISNKIPEPEINQMQTIITHLKDKLNEQTLILQQQAIKPETRDVAIMHVVDKIEPVKPELRDVAINHSTVDESKELIEKQTIIINNYIDEIETLKVENVKLSANLEELIKKHSKHVVTRGTHAPEQPVLYSVGTNTKKCTTRDVQVMYTPKSRDVSLNTDYFCHTRDVGLLCNIEDIETRVHLEELNEIKFKYELMLEEQRNNIKSYRDVNTLCRLDFKESRDVSLGCNMDPVKEYRDVSLKCNLDEEFKKFRDVSIACKLDQKPEQKDANIYVNTIEPVVKPVVRDFGTLAQIEDPEKLKLIKQVQTLQTPKPNRDVSVSVDNKTRLMEDLLRNQSSGTEQLRTISREVNTEQKRTRDSSTESSLKYSESSCQVTDTTHEAKTVEILRQKEKIETERNVLISLNTELKSKLKEMEEKLYFEQKRFAEYQCNEEIRKKNQASLTQIEANTTTLVTVEPIIRKRETEFEHHKITRTDSTKRTIDETVKMSASVSNKPGEKETETQIFTNKTEINHNKGLLLKNEITIPIVNDSVVVKSKPPMSPSKNMLVIETSEKNVYDKNGDVIEKKISEKVELKKPKGILKAASSETSQTQRKALSFGENEILETFASEASGSELSSDELGHSSTIVHSEQSEINKTELDDYELTEASCSYEVDLNKQTKCIQEEDSNDSNVKRSIVSKQSSKQIKQQVSKSFELELELHIACAILNDSLYEPLKADKTKVARALNLIQQDWFKLAAQKDSDPVLVEEHLNAFYSRFSNLLLERIVNMADLNHNTALHYSVSTGNFEIVNLLLDSKVCDVNAQNKAGYTSIMLAAVIPVKDDFERRTLKRLFSEGNVNIKSTDCGQTALMLAVRHGNKDTVGLLLEAGADCNLQDKEGSTALMAACEHGHIDIVRLLLDNTNCDPDIKDHDGETAFDIAKNKNRNDIIVLLYAHSSKLRSHHPAIQFSKSRPRIGSAGSSGKK